MQDFNQCTLVGRLTKDPEIKKVNGRDGEISVCNFSLAVNDGKDDDDVSFFEITCWGKVADSVSKYCFKGNRVLVNGRLKQDRWEKDGEKRTKVKIVNAMVHFLTPKSKDGASSHEPATDQVTHQHAATDDSGAGPPPHSMADMPSDQQDMSWDDNDGK